MTITLNSLSGKLCIFIHLAIFLGFYLVLLFGTYSSASSFCLSQCIYVLDGSAMSPGVASWWPYVEGVLWCPVTQSLLALWGCLLCGLHTPVVARLPLLQVCWWTGLSAMTVCDRYRGMVDRACPSGAG